MTLNKQFIVSTFGLTQRDRGMLGRGLRLSSGRSRSYELREDSLEEADIVFVGYASLSALPELESNQGLIVVFDRNSLDPIETEYKYSVVRPLLAPRVLDVLDRVTTEKLEFIPELVVGAVSENDINFLHSEEQVFKARISKDLQYVETLNKQNKKGKLKDNKRVLVVDDSLIVREQMKLILEGLGSSVVTCSSGKEALQEVERNDYDIIFLDVIMPGLSGFDTCKQLKKKKINDVKIIMLTSKGSPVSRVRGRLSGANTYITKPATIDKLSRFV